MDLVQLQVSHLMTEHRARWMAQANLLPALAGYAKELKPHPRLLEDGT